MNNKFFRAVFVSLILALSACGKSVTDFAPYGGSALTGLNSNSSGNNNPPGGGGPTQGVQCDVLDLSEFYVKQGCIRAISCSQSYPGPNCYEEVHAPNTQEWADCRTLPNLDRRQSPSDAPGDYPLLVSAITFGKYDISQRVYTDGFPYLADPLKSTMNEFYALSCVGQIDIQTAGTYDFKTMSDDGVRLVIDGTNVIENVDAHAPTADHGSIALTQGMYTYKVEWFQYVKNLIALELFWQTPGGYVHVPETALFH